MSLLVTGTVGIDTVETPQTRVDDVLGGSAFHFALAAGLIHPVRLVAVVGDDFPPAMVRFFEGRSIDTSGLEVRRGSKTFRWHGKYHDDMNQRDSLRTDLNVIAEAPPPIPAHFRDSAYIFLGNTHPAVQRGFIEQFRGTKLIALDTMDLWINTTREELLQTLRLVHGVIMNDGEARQLTDQREIVPAAREILKMGPHFVAVKKGEHGAVLVTNDEIISLPAYPTLKVVDPTGAGDSFAGGMMAYLASVDRIDLAALRTGLAYGVCLASICIEDFSSFALKAATHDDVNQRLATYRRMLTFD
ncbi:MAG TPA: PfkB family carbohydrate kinase [Phycisphaerae bacterium]|nr:PfkB family carbohydrate kinase [Phycisphaerae bacterium]